MKQEVYELFPIIDERKKQSAGTLSGGEQQMLAVGRALMSGPKLLMLDEPSLGLAPLVVMNIMDTLVRIKERGTAILLVEQNAAESLRIAGHGYVLETGAVVLSGKGSDLMNDEKVRQSYLGASTGCWKTPLPTGRQVSVRHRDRHPFPEIRCILERRDPGPLKWI